MSEPGKDWSPPPQPPETEDSQIANLRAGYRSVLDQGERDPLEAINAQINALDPESRAKLAYDLFGRAFKNRIPPIGELRLRVEGENEPTTEDVMEGITEGDLQSFQEYGFNLRREGLSLVPVPSKSADRQGNPVDNWYSRDLDQDDLVMVEPGDSRFDSGAPRILRGIARAFPGMSYDWNSGHSPNGELYCLVGEKNGKIIVQGGGETHRDRSLRSSLSTFRLIFSDPQAAKGFMEMLQEKPSEILHPIFSEGIEVAKTKGGERTIQSPFDTVTKVGILDLRTGQSSFTSIPQTSQTPQAQP